MSSYDYVIAGGGTAGCVLAARMKQADPSLSIALLEAGSNEHENPQIINPLASPTLHGTPLEWNYKSVPQQHYGNRRVDMFGGRLLSGSTGVNYGLWTRGSAADYDLWAEMVGDKGWSYEAMLPYFKKTEHYHTNDTNTVADEKNHGYDGPINTTGGHRSYPLRQGVNTMWSKVGVKPNRDANSGNPFGLAEYTENWHKGKRQPAGQAYGVVGSGVEVITHALVGKILFQGKTATGVELVDGRKILAHREVIVSCGAMRTPQLLMLSGIGLSKELAKHGISPVHTNEHVGGNFHDHTSIISFWKLKSPELGRALGHPGFNKPEYQEGIPTEWLITASAPKDEWEAAAKKDGFDLGSSQIHTTRPRADIETLMAYAPLGSVPGFQVPFDGSHISTAALCLLPIARGNVTLANTDPSEMPLLDPNYYGCEADRVVLRSALRLAISATETPEGQSFIEEETPPEGFPRLNSKSSDAELDHRIKSFGGTWWHPAGTASMGTVVDTQCRVKGVEKLRVVDASILPTPLSAHYQAPMYAIGERMAQVILGKA